MKIILFILAAVRILRCSGIPCEASTRPEVPPALNATLTKVNEESTLNNLFTVTGCELVNVTDAGERVFEANLVIEVQKAECLNGSGSDPAQYELKPVLDLKRRRGRRNRRCRRKKGSKAKSRGRGRRGRKGRRKSHGWRHGSSSETGADR
uniref:secreted phosphoprotein 24-like n=1 Tax=Pristiophorus japonicus TaxID=55135 RepID=UPI00398F8CF3